MSHLHDMPVTLIHTIQMLAACSVSAMPLAANVLLIVGLAECNACKTA